MEELLQQINQHKEDILAFEATTAEAAEAFRIKYLGTKGIVKAVMGEMKSVPNDRKKEFGQMLNEFKQFTEARYEAIKETTGGTQGATTDSQIDLSLPGLPIETGNRHPLQHRTKQHCVHF